MSFLFHDYPAQEHKVRYTTTPRCGTVQLMRQVEHNTRSLACFSSRLYVQRTYIAEAFQLD